METLKWALMILILQVSVNIVSIIYWILDLYTACSYKYSFPTILMY